ncbi:MAG: hypothetical protein AB9917_00045 [Negativicutes bacterium]
MADLFPTVALPDPQLPDTATEETVFGRNVALNYENEEFFITDRAPVQTGRGEFLGRMVRKGSFDAALQAFNL